MAFKLLISTIVFALVGCGDGLNSFNSLSSGVLPPESSQDMPSDENQQNDDRKQWDGGTQQPSPRPSPAPVDKTPSASATRSYDVINGASDAFRIAAISKRECRLMDRVDQSSVYNIEKPSEGAKNLHFAVISKKGVTGIITNKVPEWGGSKAQPGLAENFANGKGFAGPFDSTKSFGTKVYPAMFKEGIEFSVSKSKLQALEQQEGSSNLVLLLFDDKNGNGAFDVNDQIISSSHNITSRQVDTSSMQVAAEWRSKFESYNFQISSNLYEAVDSCKKQPIQQQMMSVAGECIIDDAGNLIGDCEQPTPSPAPAPAPAPDKEWDNCELIDEVCDEKMSPLVVDLLGNDFDLTGTADGVLFDLDADGKKDQSGWISKGSDDVLVVFDKNGNGMIDDGSELFGTSTEVAPGIKANNGFEALRLFDYNNDLVVDDKELDQLYIWDDFNHNGISDAGELIKLTDIIVSISLEYIAVHRQDSHGNAIYAQSTVKLRTGQTRVISDVWFVVK